MKTVVGERLRPALSGERREVVIDGIGRVSWYQAGPPGSRVRPLLLIHSVNAAASAYEVKPLYDHYARDRTVVAIDLPGYGCSERSNRTYTPRLMCDAIDAVLQIVRRDHGGATVDAIALSLGAEFLARVALERPDSLATLAFISPTGFNQPVLREGADGETLGSPRALALLRNRAYRRALFGLLTRRGVIRYFLRRTWGSRAIDEGLLDYDYLTTRAVGAEYAPFYFISGFLFSADIGRVYRALQQPVWVTHGVRGDFVTYAGLAALGGTPNWTVSILPTGAMPHFECLAEFVTRYDGWHSAHAGNE